MHIGVAKETAEFEKRVALTPETAKKLIKLGCEISMEKDAGAASYYPDAQYKEAGVKIVPTAEAAYKSADVVLCVQLPKNAEKLKKDTVLIGMLNPFKNEAVFKKLDKAKVTAFSLERVPRITRAQSMDVLSSQTNLAGYRAVIEGMEQLGRAMPMMMTAAGSIRPAKTVIMGAGVAGLQAIATAKRMGSMVYAFDVRAAAKEQVESLGGTFVEVEQKQDAETAGGYAKEMDADYKKRQQEKIAETLKDADLVITTALIPGKPAPELVSEKVVKTMKAGAVIVDMAIEAGGNCPLTELNKVKVVNDVKLVGYPNLPSRLAFDASALYARNVYNFIDLLWRDEKRTLAPDWNDEIVQAAAVSNAQRPEVAAEKEEKKAM